ncbi:CVNH domain-containing protein [Fusarium falciforme]|uniref:CVNH domain-containing protein n=1 Tax=Fusarium falciforme TaxID=195108 RepID=UPI0023010F96|nr:CVNH domain-containing protein [Fusarium falciforme]WAO84948.1 CVNH domain-containing protein [Fusarium falciforme]
MNFHLEAKNVRLENDHYLRASISFDGKWEDVSLDLDLYIGNNNGALSWGGSSESLSLAEEMRYANMSNPRSDFSLEATSIRLGKDPYGGWCPVLYATLPDSNGVTKSCGIYLGRCIGIENSNLTCDISKAHLTEPVRNPDKGINYFLLPSQYRRGY